MEYTQEEKEKLIKEMHQKLFMEADFENYVDIYYKIVPTYLYQYRRGLSVEENPGNFRFYDIENLYSNVVWASAASKFNDPFDCRLLLKANNLSNAKKIVFNKALSEYSEEFAEHTYVSCFCENKASLCMWSYYANDHKGFCVEYETEHIKEEVIPVNYSNEILNVETFIKSDLGILKYTLTKSPDWKHECEWRMANCEDYKLPSKNGKLLESCKPSKIYLGCKSDKKLIEAITEFCNKQKVDLSQMVMNTVKYELEPKSVLKF